MERISILKELAKESGAEITASGSCISIVFDNDNFTILPDYNTFEENVEEAISCVLKKVFDDQMKAAEVFVEMTKEPMPLGDLEVLHMTGKISDKEFNTRLKELYSA